LAPSNACRSSYLSDDQIAENIEKADRGDANAKERLLWHYEQCDRNMNTMIHFYKRYEFLQKEDYNLSGFSPFWTQAMYIWRDRNNIEFLDMPIIEQDAPRDPNARILAYGLYNGYIPALAYFRFKNIPKSLYYAKLDGCDTNNEYSYASYLYMLFHNYPDDKEYLKVTYAMLLFTKFNAYNFYKYSNLDALEQNITTRVDYKDIEYVISNYRDIIAKECEGILADHDQVPTEEKLMKYAFPLKSGKNETIKR
jgi:hypothetical protein